MYVKMEIEILSDLSYSFEVEGSLVADIPKT